MKSLTASTEGETNFIGRYKSQLTHDWYLLSKLYNKNTLWRAEHAKCLQQLVGFDLPGLRKQIKQNEKALGEYEAKVRSLEVSIGDLTKKYASECQKYKLDSAQDLTEQIFCWPKSLVVTFIQIEELAKSLKDICALYKMGGKDSLKLLTWLAENGDSHVCEWDGKSVTDELALKIKHKYAAYERFETRVVHEISAEQVEVVTTAPAAAVDWSNVDCEFEI
jgi:hypothetical protein